MHLYELRLEYTGSSEFKIEKSETVFDSVTEPRDKLSLHVIRNLRKSNAIHASIHEEDWKIGWEDGWQQEV